MFRYDNFKALTTLVLVSLTIAAPSLAAPNLVPNPSFTNVTQCPDKIDLVTGQVHFAAPWTSAGATPDLFHGCGLIHSVEVPDNAFGQECPWEENCAGSTQLGGYAGVAVWFGSCDWCREYIQVPLTQSLQAGVKYRVEFYVSLSEFSQYGVDRMGAYLSNGPVVPINDVLPFTPQVENPAGTVLDQKTGWTKISGKFTASGGEDHLIIGNFYEDSETTAGALSTGGTFEHAYYYVDMVSVRKADITDIQIPGPPGPGGDIQIVLTGGAPNSPVTFYASNALGGSEADGGFLDIGPSLTVMGTAITDQQGFVDTFVAIESAPAPGPSGEIYFEATVQGPRGDTSDSNEVAYTPDPVTGVSPVSLTGRLGNVSASPNPFNPQTVLSYELHAPGPVKVEVFDARGRTVRVLADLATQGTGRHSVLWNGRDETGRFVSTGVYYARIVTTGEMTSHSLVMIK